MTTAADDAEKGERPSASDGPGDNDGRGTEQTPRHQDSGTNGGSSAEKKDEGTASPRTGRTVESSSGKGDKAHDDGSPMAPSDPQNTESKAEDRAGDQGADPTVVKQGPPTSSGDGSDASAGGKADEALLQAKAGEGSSVAGKAGDATNSGDKQGQGKDGDGGANNGGEGSKPAPREGGVGDTGGELRETPVEKFSALTEGEGDKGKDAAAVHAPHDEGDNKADGPGTGKAQTALNFDALERLDRPPSASGSQEGSFYEGDPDDMDENLDKPWVKPSLPHALDARKRMIWNQGKRSYFGTSLKEIGSMGVGMFLYFWVVRIVAIAFLVCAALSLPALILNHEGNDGMALSETDVDSLGLVFLSYGHQGVDPDLVVESGCISSNGTVDCTGETVQVFGETEEALHVGYVLAGSEIAIAIFFAVFIVVLSEKLEAKIEEIDESNVTPADYSIMVRGLPGDVTKEEVQKHFNDRYSLVAPGPSYPFLGVSITGAAVFWSSTVGLVFGVMVTPSIVGRSGMKGPAAFGIGVLTVFLCIGLVFASVEGCRIGAPRRRDTPLQEWEKGRKQRLLQQALARKKEAASKKKNEASSKKKQASSKKKDASSKKNESTSSNKKTEASSKQDAASGKVLPVETGAAAGSGPAPTVNTEIATGNGNTAAGNEDIAAGGGEAGGGSGDSAGVGKEQNEEKEAAVDVGEPGALEAGLGGGGGAGGETGEGVAVPAVGEEGTIDEEPPPDPLPCQSCLNSHDKMFIGSWVADVVLGNPVGGVLRGFMNQEASFAKIRKARTVVRQMKTLGKEKDLAKAEAKLAKLKAKEEVLMAATRKKQDPAALENISVAFVTFEHQESKRRCLEDYRYSRRGFCRRFQPAKLQFCRMPALDAAEGGSSPSPDESTSPSGRKKKDRPRAQKWRLKVFQAPEPGDVKWENLDVTPASRKLRRAVTSLVCVVLLIVSFSIIYLAQNEQTKLKQKIPTLDTCEETIPAVIFGTYDFPLQAALQRNETLDDTCAEGSFYLAFTVDASDSSAGLLDYTDLPDIYTANAVNRSRAEFEETESAELCDDPCNPASGGKTCSALSCYESSWRQQGYDCVTYTESTMVGCFCLDAVVTSFQEHGLVKGAQEVANEQGAICTPFLRDYAQANALKILAVLSVVIVNTLLTSVMGKLAKFERHVSLSDYTSTVTAKLAIAQFLNTALVVIIVNAGYTGGGLGLLQDVGVLGGEYGDFERGWYATVGVAVSMTMLLNVIVPHVKPLVGELLVKPIKRFLKRRSVATQADMNGLYTPPPFSMESRYAFLLQVMGVSMLYSGGIPILYLFASFSFFTNYIVDKLWIIKLTKQPPMYTAALARMFVGAMPMALFMHMALATYMLGNSDILNIEFVSLEAEALSDNLQGNGVSGLVASHVLRKHVFALFVLTVLFVGLYLAYKIVGDPLLKLVKLILGTILRVLFGWMFKKKPKVSVAEEQGAHPGYTAEYFRVLKKGERIDADEKHLGWVVGEDGTTARWLFTDDAAGPRGVKAKRGVARQTWQAIAELGQYNYVMEESDTCGVATRYMATAGFLSPRMKERQHHRMEKAEKAALTETSAAAVSIKPPGELQQADENNTQDGHKEAPPPTVGTPSPSPAPPTSSNTQSSGGDKTTTEVFEGDKPKTPGGGEGSTTLQVASDENLAGTPAAPTTTLGDTKVGDKGADGGDRGTPAR